MEDFLKDRPVMETGSAAIESAHTGEGNDPDPPFGALRSSSKGAASDVSGVNGGSPDATTETANVDPAASVKTIVERGRVTRIIVTCSCGKVTEIDCKY